MTGWGGPAKSNPEFISQSSLFIPWKAVMRQFLMTLQVLRRDGAFCPNPSEESCRLNPLNHSLKLAPQQ